MSIEPLLINPKPRRQIKSILFLRLNLRESVINIKNKNTKKKYKKPKLFSISEAKSKACSFEDFVVSSNEKKGKSEMFDKLSADSSNLLNTDPALPKKRTDINSLLLINI